jgi:WhiB family redox-sensing transcriptional regulator
VSKVQYTRTELDALTRGRRGRDRLDNPKPLFSDRLHAACATSGYHPDMWFSEDSEDQRRARMVCKRCPVQRECLLHALAVSEDDGMWGGLLPAERQDEATVRAALGA